MHEDEVRGRLLGGGNRNRDYFVFVSVLRVRLHAKTPNLLPNKVDGCYPLTEISDSFFRTTNIGDF